MNPAQLIVYAGLALIFAAVIWTMVQAFRESLFWGFVSLTGIGALAFSLYIFKYDKKPFLLPWVGLVIMILGAYLGRS